MTVHRVSQCEQVEKELELCRCAQDALLAELKRLKRINRGKAAQIRKLKSRLNGAMLKYEALLIQLGGL